MLVKDLMTTGVSCVKEDASLTQIAKQMKREDVGVIPVCNDKGEVLGVITDRDLVLRSMASKSGTCAGEIMTTNVISVAPDMDSHKAALLMAKHQVRRLPVTQNHKLIGMLSMADIARKTVFIDEAGDALSAICQVAPPAHL